MDTMRVRGLELVLLGTLEDEGWAVYASIDQKNGSDSDSETDTVIYVLLSIREDVQTE
jgi:hypothetical protein